MEFNNENGTDVKNETAKSANNSNTQNSLGRKEPAAKPQIEKAKSAEPVAESKILPTPPVVVQPDKTELPLDARLRLVNDLHRRSLQRLNLISRMNQLEVFEIALLQENDELEDNPYQGCKLIIRDDKNREFVTSTPGLIRMVSQYIFTACHEKLNEIESTIIFPNA